MDVNLLKFHPCKDVILDVATPKNIPKVQLLALGVKRFQMYFIPILKAGLRAFYKI
jgi:hypothetical protein